MTTSDMDSMPGPQPNGDGWLPHPQHLARVHHINSGARAVKVVRAGELLEEFTRISSDRCAVRDRFALFSPSGVPGTGFRSVTLPKLLDRALHVAALKPVIVLAPAIVQLSLADDLASQGLDDLDQVYLTSLEAFASPRRQDAQAPRCGLLVSFEYSGPALARLEGIVGALNCCYVGIECPLPAVKWVGPLGGEMTRVH